MPNATDWRNALKMLPLNVARRPHGRTIEQGIDCVGLIFVMYKLVGVDLKDCDVPYGQHAYRPIAPGDALAKAQRDRLSRLLQSRLTMKFKRVECYDPVDVRSGDIILLGETGSENHVGIFIDGMLIQMGDKIRVRRFHEVWALNFVAGVYRLNV